MSTITGGIVSIEDGIKSPVEYQPPRKVRVELRFDVLPDNDNNTLRLQQVAHMADRQVRELLGLEAAATSAATVDETPASAKRGRPRKAEPLPAVAPFPGAPDGAQPPAKLEGDKAPGKAEDAIAFSDDPVPPKPEATEVISDKKLFDVVVEINAKIKQGKAITAIIERYCPADGVPPSLKRIPEPKRAAFLAEVRKFAEEQTVKA